MVRRLLVSGLMLAAAVAVPATGSSAAAGKPHMRQIKHIVVIYEENHSFDNLYGGWEGVNGLANADAAHTVQVDEAGRRMHCLLQNDVNLQRRPLAPTCSTDSTPGRHVHQRVRQPPFTHRRLHRAGPTPPARRPRPWPSTSRTGG